jgi:hypothetical protein
VEYVEEEGDAAGAKTCGAGGEGMPTAAMAEARMDGSLGLGGAERGR